MEQDLTPKWDIIPAKEKIIPNDSDFGGQIGGIGSPTVTSVKQTQDTVITNTSSINILGWTSNLVFSSLDYNTVAWAAGSIILKDGTTYSISGSNTGNMSAVTYIYFDGNVSTTALQTTTTASSSVGTNKILIAVAQNNTDTTSEASFQVFGGAGGFMITRNGIAANTITANEIAANTITSSQLTATAIDAMTVTGALLRTAASGKRVEINGTGLNNNLKFYDSVGQVIGIGTDAGTSIKIDLTSATSNGIQITSSVAGNSIYIENSGDVAVRGLYVAQANNGSNNTLACADLIHYGHGYALKIGSSHESGSITITHDGTPSAINITDNSSSTANASIYIAKSNAGKHMELYSSCTSSNDVYGITFDLNNSGSGLEHAFRFVGAEQVSAAVSGTQDKKIRVMIGATVYYIPCYTG